MTTNLIEQAKAMAERLERDQGYRDPAITEKAAALIRQLIAQIEGDQNAGSGTASPSLTIASPH